MKTIKLMGGKYVNMYSSSVRIRTLQLKNVYISIQPVNFYIENIRNDKKKSKSRESFHASRHKVGVPPVSYYMLNFYITYILIT